MRRAVAAALLFNAVALIACEGCGQTSSATPLLTVPVKGKVSYKGQPLTRGTILFEPEGMGKDGHGEVQPDGTFVLTTYKPGDGAVIGAHRVAVTGGAGKGSTGKIPGKYGSLGSSKLTVEVSPDKADYPLDLR